MISVININLHAEYIRFEILRKKKPLHAGTRKIIWCPYGLSIRPDIQYNSVASTYCN